MQIKLASITVDDQTKALHFYTTVLGFTKQTDITNGPFRWLTVSSPDGVAGVELVLEPMGFPPAGIYQKARFEAGIPSTAFFGARHRSRIPASQKFGSALSWRTDQDGPGHSSSFRGYLWKSYQFGSTSGVRSRRSQPPLALSVPLSRLAATPEFSFICD